MFQKLAIFGFIKENEGQCSLVVQLLQLLLSVLAQILQ